MESGAFVNGDGALPFWLRSNNYGRVGRQTDIYAIIESSYKLNLNENSAFTLHSGFTYRNEFNEIGGDNNVFVDELYANYSSKFLNINVGVKHDDLKYNGLASTNQSILWSNNSRSLPGIEVKTSRPIYFLLDNHLGFEALFSEYYLNDNRATENAHVHHKYLSLVYKLNSASTLRLGVRHIVQYGGNPSDSRYENQPIGVEEYVRMFLGRAGSDNSLPTDQENAIGNHLGSYELSYNRKIENGEFELFYNSIFEDGSGSAMRNFPDGRYGAFYDSGKKDHLINSFVYEFIYTKNQSQTAPHLWDNYFNHGVYSSGWTYQNKVIGLPFITSTYLSDYGGDYIAVGNNRLIAHHFGVQGKLYFPYEFKASYRRNYGFNQNVGSLKYRHYDADDERSLFKVQPEVVSTYLKVGLLRSFLDLDVMGAVDFSDKNSNFAAGLSVSKSFF
ncbi:capsule assembly Wzi family protein [Zunongwangia endophytica]|uniref:Capsule assembly Wzi family protein n=1 Tax=Zunongwangia endophytica TaxID=1808945 RepID=A0ABV8H8K0_9FLAO|nr:capsule assembly Wzi family protein [Zunongwangia endophytica]MDN3596254.1 capsule assembly Wzi family protein [Zunongwangia endophytica]